MNFRDSDTQYFHGVLGRQRVGWRSNPRFRVFSSALLRLSYRPVMSSDTFQRRKQPDVLRHRAVKRHSLPYLVSFAQRTLKHGRIRMDSMLLIGVRGLLKNVVHVLWCLRTELFGDEITGDCARDAAYDGPLLVAVLFLPAGRSCL